MKDIKSLKKFFQTPRKLAITTHRNPDGDAIGSSLALYHYFRKKGHHVAVIVPNGFGESLKWLPGNNGLIHFENHPDKGTAAMDEAELIFCMDYNRLDRTETMEKYLQKSSTPKVLIDHHLNPGGFDTYRLWDPNASATCELAFDFLFAIDDDPEIDQDIAVALYTGIITDSGSFRFSNTSPKTHRIVAKLMETGFNHSRVHQRVFDNFKENNLRFFGYCLNEKLRVLKEYRTAYIFISQEEIKRFNIQKGQMEGLVNFPLSMDEIVFSALIKEHGNLMKMSFRSKDDFPANKFAGEFFRGGGHRNAAGGKCEKSLEETVKLFEDRVKSFKDQLLAV